MRQRWGSLLGGFLVFVAGFYAGGYFGAHRLWAITEPVMRMEVAASIHFGIDELIYLRTDQADKALRRMGQRLAGAILGGSGGGSPHQLSPDERQSLLLAKRYRARYPFAEASPEAEAALSAVADGTLDPMVARTAARALLTESEAATMKLDPVGSTKP